jgi:hypothetical protein
MKDSVLAIGSPFPWSPGHTWLELELLALKKLASSDHRIYIYPVLNPDYASLMDSRLRLCLIDLNIRIVSDHSEILNYFKSSDFIDVSLSHVKHLKRSDVAPEHYRVGSHDYFTDFANYAGISSINQPYISSNQLIHTDYQDYCNLYCDLPAPFASAYKPIARTDLAKRILDLGKPIIVLNIREHTANASAGMHADDFIPLVSYLHDNNFIVIDMSHESKSTDCLDFCKKYNVIPYWSFNDKSKESDYDLLANCEYFIGSGGLAHIATTFRVPILWIGNLYPVQIASDYGFQLPCSLFKLNSGAQLSPEEHFLCYYFLPELWDEKYDSFLRKFGPYNMHNCIDYFRSSYIIRKPSAYSILTAFIEMSRRKVAVANISSSYSSMIPRDLLGRNLITLACYV